MRPQITNATRWQNSFRRCSTGALRNPCGRTGHLPEAATILSKRTNTSELPSLAVLVSLIAEGDFGRNAIFLRPLKMRQRITRFILQHRDNGGIGRTYYEHALQELNSDPAYLKLW